MPSSRGSSQPRDRTCISYVSSSLKGPPKGPALPSIEYQKGHTPNAAILGTPSARHKCQNRQFPEFWHAACPFSNTMPQRS